MGKQNDVIAKDKIPNPSNAVKSYDIEIGDSYTMGPDDAKVTIIEWMDFQWPHCASSVSLADDILNKYPDDVRLVIKHFPLSFHKEARKASLYSLAAERQGKFLEMYYKIMENYKCVFYR